MPTVLKLPLWSYFLLILGSSACKTKHGCDPADKAMAQATIAKWNQEHPDQLVSIVDWPELKAQCEINEGGTLLLVMANYCHGVDVALTDIDQIPDSSRKKPHSVIWVSNDAYKDVGLFMDKVRSHGFKGELDILDNDVFGCYLDQRERNKELLKAICGDNCGDVIYQSGLVVILLDHEGKLTQAGNVVGQVLGTGTE